MSCPLCHTCIIICWRKTGFKMHQTTGTSPRFLYFNQENLLDNTVEFAFGVMARSSINGNHQTVDLTEVYINFYYKIFTWYKCWYYSKNKKVFSISLRLWEHCRTSTRRRSFLIGTNRWTRCLSGYGSGLLTRMSEVQVTTLLSCQCRALQQTLTAPGVAILWLILHSGLPQLPNNLR